MFSVAIKRLSYSLSWSFILAVLGFVVNFAAGVLMCVGRNISKNKTKKSKPTQRTMRGRTNPSDEIQMEETSTARKNVWTSHDGPEVRAPNYPTKKIPLPRR